MLRGVQVAFFSLVCAFGTVAPLAADEAPYRLVTVAEGLSLPWSVAFLPDNVMLVTEKTGALRVIRDGVLDPEPVAGVPEVLVGGQGGLLEVAVHPDDATLVYLTYAHGTPQSNATRVARARFDGETLRDLEVLFTADPRAETTAHYGGRLQFLPDTTFLLTLGDGFTYREDAQRLNSHIGKILRLNADGSVPSDNPYVGQSDAKPEIWSYGHRNVQGVVYDDSRGLVYAHEHGPRGGDELNLIEKGNNYGWPVITYGVDYNGAVISPYTEKPGMEQPLVYWDPSIAPAGMTIYTGDDFPDWKGDIFIAALVRPGHVERIDLDEDGRPVAPGKIGADEGDKLFTELDERIRDVRMGPDGHLYLLTDNSEGRLIRVDPAN